MRAAGLTILKLTIAAHHGVHRVCYCRDQCDHEPRARDGSGRQRREAYFEVGIISERRYPRWHWSWHVCVHICLHAYLAMDRRTQLETGQRTLSAERPQARCEYPTVSVLTLRLHTLTTLAQEKSLPEFRLIATSCRRVSAKRYLSASSTSPRSLQVSSVSLCHTG